MDTQQVGTFLAVAEELHFGRAAERLHMAQPPVSRSIKQLESTLGTQLFERSTRSVALTPAGESLIGPAREILRATQHFHETALAAGKGEVGHVRLAYAGASSHAMVGRLARAVKHTHPGIRFELISQQFAQMAMTALVRDDIDIALGRWDHVPAAVDSQVVAIERLVVAVPDTHHLADHGTVSANDLRGERFVSLPAETGTVLLDRLRGLARDAGFSAEVVQYAPDTWTVMSLVSAEVGCALTLSSVIDSIADPHLRFLELSDPVDPIELRIAWKRSRRDHALAAVLKIAEEVLPDGTS